jgi:hypothetical protein
MNQLKTTPPLLITLALLCFALLPRAQAVVPPPDGFYQRIGNQINAATIFTEV